MSNSSNQKCPICELELPEAPRDYEPQQAKVVHCTRCGEFVLDALAALGMSQRGLLELSLLSHVVRRMQRDGAPPYLDDELVERLLDERQHPSPTQQVENLVLWLGEHILMPGREVAISPKQHRAIVGAWTDGGFTWLVNHAFDIELLEGRRVGQDASATLSFKGWELYERLRRGQVQSRTAFMAMSFRNKALDEIFRRYFKPAVKKTGFELLRLDEGPPAGSIDNRLRVELRVHSPLIGNTFHTPDG